MTTNFKLRKALSFFCAAVLLLSLIPVFAFADDTPADPDLCELTVSVPEALIKDFPELKNCEINVRLYKVAELFENDGHVEPLSQYTNIAGLDKITPFSMAEEIYEVSEKLVAEIGDKTEPDYILSVKNGTGSLSGLAKGLYLAAADDVIAGSDRFSSKPVLIMLPMASMFVNKSFDWNTKAEIVLKMEQVRFGALKIIKTLNGHLAVGEDAAFVFHAYVTQTDEKGNTVIVHDDVHTISFTKSGTQSIVIEGLPIGSIATVEEVYTGRFVSQTPIKVEGLVIPAVDYAEASFINIDYPFYRRGHSVENIYTYDAELGYGFSEQIYHTWYSGAIYTPEN